MCTKICDYHFTVKEAGKLLDDQFSYINLIQLLFIYNHHMHISYLDLLEEMDILFYMIQTVSEDNKMIKVTIVWDYYKRSTREMIKRIKEIEKENSRGKYKVTIIA